MNNGVSKYASEANTLRPHLPTTRFPVVDQLRGIGVVLMIIFHFAYDLAYYRYIPNGSLFEWPLLLTQRVGIIIFLTCVGISLCMANAKGMRWSSFWRREARVGGAAFLVSLATYCAYAESWVYFGVLHCIAVSSLVALPLIRFPKIALVVSLVILVSYFGWDMTLPWIELDHAPFDYWPLFPWVGYVLLGIVAYHIGAHRWWHAPAIPPVRGLQFLGRHSLIIYLTHLPLLMGLVWAYYTATH
ncbi:MAG: DUF1624 domain-containing protein [Chloroflexi bacterium]|nr:DUF1624 domain-containing protein [Chloroflexota bacterium]